MALVIQPDGVLQQHRGTITELAAKHRLPAIYAAREFIDAGGLALYGVSYPDLYRRAATYVDRFSRVLSRRTYRSSSRPASSW